MANTLIETLPAEQRCHLCRDVRVPPLQDCPKCQAAKNRHDLLASAQWTPLMETTVAKCFVCHEVDVDGELTGQFICEECLVNRLKVENHNHCNKCGKEIPYYKDGTGTSGYESQTHHLHEAGIGGVAGTRQVKMRLCRECYREDYNRMYPSKAVTA
jgi:hypothetical protein